MRFVDVIGTAPAVHPLKEPRRDRLLNHNRMPLAAPSPGAEGLLMDLTNEERQALEDSLGAIRRIAMKVIELPKDQRERQYANIRSAFENSIRKYGVQGEPIAKWLDNMMAAIRALVAEIEAGGGAPGGHA
jgi:hypothetical protein